MSVLIFFVMACLLALLLEFVLILLPLVFPVLAAGFIIAVVFSAAVGRRARLKES